MHIFNNLLTENQNLRDQMALLLVQMASTSREKFVPPPLYAVAIPSRMRALEGTVDLYVRVTSPARVEYVLAGTVEVRNGAMNGVEITEEILCGYYLRDDLRDLLPYIRRSEIERGISRAMNSNLDLKAWFSQPRRGDKWARGASDALIAHLRPSFQNDTIDWEEIARDAVWERKNMG